MRKNVKYAFKILFVSLLQMSCTESKHVLTPVTTSAEQNTTTDKLLFINLNFWKIDGGKDSCKVINTMVADGTLRGEEHHEVHNKESYYTVLLNSCKGKALYKEEIDNQLDTQMEVYNEDGKIELKKVSFKQREYSIKIQQGKEKICRVIVTKNEKGEIKTICNHLL